MADEKHYLDKEGLENYNNKIATIIKNSLAKKADVSKVSDIITQLTTFETIDDHKASVDTINANINKLNQDLNTLDESKQPKGDYPTLAEVTNTINDNLKEYEKKTEHSADITTINTKIDTINNSITSLNKAVGMPYSNVSTIDNRVTSLEKEQVDKSDYYTKTETDNKFLFKADKTDVTSIQTQVNNISQVIQSGTSSTTSVDSTVLDLSNIYYWGRLSSKDLVIHNGDDITDDKTGYNRDFFKMANMYRRTDVSFFDTPYTMSISGYLNIGVSGNEKIEITEISHDFKGTDTNGIYVWSRDTGKKFLGNTLTISNVRGISDISNNVIIGVTAWNKLIGNFTLEGDNQKLILGDEFVSGLLNISIKPFQQTSTKKYYRDPSTTTIPETKYWTWNFVINDSSSNKHKEFRLYINNSAEDYSYFLTSDYRDKYSNMFDVILKNRGYTVTNMSTYYNDQNFVKAYEQTESDLNNNYYLWLDLDSSKVSRSFRFLKKYFIELFYNIYCGGLFKEGAYGNNIFFTIKDLSTGQVTLLPETPTDSDKNIIVNLLNYLGCSTTKVEDEQTSYITVTNRLDQDYILEYASKTITAQDCFVSINSTTTVQSLGGKTGVITFDNPVGETSDMVTFSIDENNKLKGTISHPAIPGAVPTGCTFLYPSSTAPSGYLLCDGSTFDKDSYAALYEILGSNVLPNLENIIKDMHYVIKI